jgi:hypothetical protein
VRLILSFVLVWKDGREEVKSSTSSCVSRITRALAAFAEPFDPVRALCLRSALLSPNYAASAEGSS